ncbi:MAG: EAL domain-containing protein [Pseudomonadales bacterium]|nr:EAL domain-containing protein [Pseudomonadales bacterium]
MQSWSDTDWLDLSLALVEAPTAGHDNAIHRFLGKLGDRFQACRCSLHLLDHAGAVLRRSHAWQVEDHTLAPGWQRLTLARFPWLVAQLRGQRQVTIDQPEALGQEAAAEKSLLQKHQTRSLVMVPVSADGADLGYLSCEGVRQALPSVSEVASGLAPAARMLASAVQGWLDANERRRLDQSLSTFASQFPGVVYQFQLFPDGFARCPFISDTVEQLFEVPAAQAREDVRPLLARIHPEDLGRFFEAIETSRANLTPWFLQFRGRRPSGEVFWVEARSVPEPQPDGSMLWHGYFHDITAQVEAQRRLRQQAEQTEAILANVADAILTIDHKGRIRTFNPAAERIFGLQAGDVIDHPVAELLTYPHRRSLYRLLRKQGGLVDGREVEGVRADGSVFPAEVKLSVIDVQGDLRYVAAVRDLSQSKRAEAEIEQLAFFDPLTGLPNRRLLVDRLVQAQASSERNNQHAALVFIDLDDFKTINDSAGHAVGDELLRQVGQRLSATVKDLDTVARLGGDEFVLILKGFAGDPTRAATQVEKVCERVRRQLNRPYRLSGGEYTGSPSLGVTLFFGRRRQPDELLRHADLAMYRAKENGKNRIAFYDAEMQRIVTERLQLESDLHLGLKHGQFQLHYQLQVDCQQQPAGVEALVRWHSPERGWVSPGAFIPLAEENGFIVPLGHWVLDQACHQLAQWQAAPAPFSQLVMAVNVSARQFHQPAFVASVEAALARSGAPPRLLKLELTESVFAQDLELIRNRLQRLKALGIRVSLDDFGTGYSSLGYLKRLPLDELKIDQGFVRSLHRSAGDAAIARMIIALAAEMELMVVAEGVERDDQFQALVAMGCDRFQGFLFARPLALAEVESLLQGVNASPGTIGKRPGHLVSGFPGPNEGG